MTGELLQHSCINETSKLLDIPGKKLSSVESPYPIHPSQALTAAIDIADDRLHWAAFHWGLIPHWAKDQRIGEKMHYARAETLTEKPSFRTAYRFRRCIIPADVFVEQKTGSGSLPIRTYTIKHSNKAPLLIAGLWDHWEHKQQRIQSCAVITTCSHGKFHPYAERMPAILTIENAQQWLNHKIEDTQTLSNLLLQAHLDIKLDFINTDSLTHIATIKPKLPNAETHSLNTKRLF